MPPVGALYQRKVPPVPVAVRVTVLAPHGVEAPIAVGAGGIGATVTLIDDAF